MKKALLLVLGLVLVGGMASAEVIARYGLTTDGSFDTDGIRSGKDSIEKQTGTRMKYRGSSFSYFTGNFIAAPNVYRADNGDGLSTGKYYTNAAASLPNTVTEGKLGTYLNFRERQSTSEVIDRATRGFVPDLERSNFPETRSLFRQTFWFPQ